MMPKGKADYMTLDISIAEGCTCKSSTYQQISDRLCRVLACLQYKTNLEKKLARQAGQPLPKSHTRNTRPRPHPDHEAIFKGQNNQKLCLSFCHSLVSKLTSFFCTIFCIFIRLFIKYSIPKHSHCIKPLQYLSWPFF